MTNKEAVNIIRTAIAEVEWNYPLDYAAAFEMAVEALKEQVTKAGTWQWKIHGKPESGGTLGEAICDQCGKSTFATAVKGDLNYCPNCGAKMFKG